MKLIKSKKGLALLAVLAVVAIAAVGAYAYFTSTGTGAGTATTGSSANWVVGQDAYGPTYPAVTLFPGQGTQPLQGTVKNNGQGNQQLDTITATIEAPTVNAANAAAAPNACTAADYALSAASGWVVAPDGLSAVKTFHSDVIAGATVSFSGLDVSMIDRQDVIPGDGTGNQNGCQAATVNIQYDAA
jgi:uncharacterized protein (UPF0333 family)